MNFRKPLLIAALLLAPLAAQAQQLTQPPAERAALVRDAFASDYGKALTAELGKSLRKDADPACLGAKGLEAGQLEARGRDLLIKWGTHLGDATAELYDTKVYAERFAGAAELERLQQNADVKRYLAIAAPARQAKLLDMIFEQFERYVLVKRIKLTPVSPLGTGNEELLAKNPTDATEEALDKFAASRKSAALNRFLDLSDQSVAVATASMRKDPAMAIGSPLNLLKGVETDLAELCIGSRL